MKCEKEIEQLLLQNYDKYYRLAFSYVHNSHDAGDIVQNGAYKAILNSSSLKNKAYASTWIYRIMLNEIFSFYRTARMASIDELGEAQDDAARSIEALAVEDSHEDLDLQKALDGLAKEDKLVVQLRYFEDMKLEEIAMILEENVSTVKSRLYRCLKKLRVKMSDHEETSRYGGIRSKRIGEAGKEGAFYEG